MLKVLGIAALLGAAWATPSRADEPADSPAAAQERRDQRSIDRRDNRRNEDVTESRRNREADRADDEIRKGETKEAYAERARGELDRLGARIEQMREDASR